MKRYAFIVNPKSGKGKGERLIPRLREEISKSGLTANLLTTEKAGHATELAKNAPSEIVVAVGGDGTVNEVANGIIGSSRVLGIIPCGSGNDLPKSISIPLHFESAFLKIVADKRLMIDCASVRCQRSDEPSNFTERFFVNGVGIGFDAAVAVRTNEITWLSGMAVYILAVFQTLGKYRSPDFTIEVDSNKIQSHNLLIAIGNGTCAGGGFYLTPEAKVDDGLLDICSVDEMSIPRILHLMPNVMKGKHKMIKGVLMKRGKEISVRAPQPFFVHADGEIVGRGVNSVEVRIKEKALNVIVG